MTDPRDERRLVLVLSAPVALPDLDDPALREEVRRCGARTLQVNVRDDAVAGAFALDVLDPPAAAVLTLTGPVSADDLLDVLSRRAGPVRGWWVESREPLRPVEPPDGVRLGALAQVAVLRRPTVLAKPEWRRIWQDEHTQVAIETQATTGYVQHRVVEALPGSPDVAAVVEEHFPMAALGDMHAFYGSGGDADELRRRMTRMLESVARFGADRDLDVVPTSRYRWVLA